MPKSAWAAIDLDRKRMQLVDTRTAYIVSIEASLRQILVNSPSHFAKIDGKACLIAVGVWAMIRPRSASSPLNWLINAVR